MSRKDFSVQVDITPCECREKYQLKQLITASNMSDNLRQKGFKNFKVTPKTKAMFDMAYKYVKRHEELIKAGKGLAITGSVGVGKTHILAAVANNLLAKKIPVCFVNTPDLIAELRQAQFSSNKHEYERKIRALSKVAVVIFDDLAKEKVKDFAREQYYRIINHRYEHRKATMFSSNCTLDELAEKLGDATTSRLVAMTKDWFVHIEAEDYRVMGE
ncbi:MAG: ATP-binding protein [Thermoanaerobacteraceae bacterium]|nr:ATP-binding protein [Thermoanaerobacteraceae bacterium]